MKDKCIHHDTHIETIQTKWEPNGSLTPIRHCSNCGKIWRLKITKSLQVIDLRPLLTVAFTPDICKAVKLSPGERWITVHPNGNDDHGVPVLIRENNDGTASVVGGAGGKLNYLRLHRLKSEEEWKKSAHEKKAAARAKEAERMKNMTDEQKAEEKESKSNLEKKKLVAESAYVDTVLSAHGISRDQWELPDKVLSAIGSDKSIDMAKKQHLRKMVKMADKLVNQAREDIVTAASATLEDIPTTDILPSAPPTGAGKGYVGAVETKAYENGLTVKEKKVEQKDISWRHFLEAADGNEEEAEKKRDNVAALHAALAMTRAPVTMAAKAGLLDVKLNPEKPDVEDIAKVLIAQKQVKKIESAYKETLRDARESGAVTNEAAFMKASEITDEQAMEELSKELDENLLTRSVRGLLDLAETESDKAPLREHVGVGRFDALNDFFISSTKSPCPVDRIVQDIIGSQCSAQLAVEALRRSGEDMDTIKSAMENFHVKKQKDIADNAVKAYKEKIDKKESIEIGQVTDADSALEASLANDTRGKLVNDGRRDLGVALGRLEGQASLVSALNENKELKELRVPLGPVGTGQAVLMTRSLGLEKEDYEIDSDGINKFLTINKGGIDKIMPAVDSGFVKKYNDAISIKKGEHDEDGWLPAGMVSRTATSFDDPHERALMASKPMELSEGMSDKNIKDSLEDYIGGRLADGQDPESLRSDMLSAEFVAENVPKSLVGDTSAGAYYKALNDMGFYSYDSTANLSGDKLNAWADQIVKKRKEKLGENANIAALNSQSIPIDSTTYEAIHRGLSKVPHAAVACKGLGELTPQDKGTLRDYFWNKISDEKKPDATATKKEKIEEEKKANEVVGHQANIFGEIEEVKRGPSEVVSDVPEDTAWDRYIKAMGSTNNAYAAIQDLARGEFMSQFASHLGKITGTEFKTGSKRIANWDRHVIGMLSPEKQAQILGEQQMHEKSRQARVASRVGGKFTKEDAAGDRRAKAEALLNGMKRSQMALFKNQQSLNSERVTLGDRAEKQLMTVFGRVAQNFDSKKPVDIPINVEMSGKDSVKRQRAIKLFESQKRMGLNLGVGSGKTSIALGSFTDLHAKGKVKRAIYAVPSAVCAQFGSEALRFLEPGKYKWFANPSATASERHAAYADDSRHMVVVTHQALRDDLGHAVAKLKFNGDTNKAHEFLMSASESERKDVVKEACDSLGWKFDASFVDEGHNLLGRQGKEDSRMANTIDALTYNTPYYMSMTADPIKNDASEAFSMLHKIDPERYADRDSFMRKYGINTAASQSALQREMMPYSYTGSIQPDVLAQRTTNNHDLLPEQKSAYSEVTSLYRRAQAGRRSGKPDVEAIKTLSPDSFKGLDDEQSLEKAKQLNDSLGMTRDAAYSRVINVGHFDPAKAKSAACKKLNDLVDYVAKDKNKEGKPNPSIVFAYNKASVKRLKEELAKKGLRVTTLTGEHTSADKEKAKLIFQGGEADVIVMSDAGATGLNLQHAGVVHQYDTPHTAMVHEQRVGRMERIGQHNPDIKAVDWVSNTPYETAKRRNLQNKSGLREIFTSPTEGIDDTGLAHEIWSAKQNKLQKDVMEAA